MAADSVTLAYLLVVMKAFKSRRNAKHDCEEM